MAEKSSGSEMKTAMITIVASVVSAVATIGVAYTGGFFDVAKTDATNRGSTKLERLKFGNDLIKGALSTANPSNSLLFYADIGLLDGATSDKVREYARRENERLARGGAGESLLPSFNPVEKPQLWLDRDFMASFAPTAPEDVVNAVVSTGNYLLHGYGINKSPQRLSMFLSQIAYESKGFTLDEEKGDFTATRIRAVWPSRFRTIEDAQKYHLQPEALLNLVYADRMGNGPEPSGDGWRFRGRGYLSMVGRNNYETMSRETGIDLVANPEMMSDPYVSFLVSVIFWASKGLNEVADEGDLEKATRRISGGASGMAERRALFDKAMKTIEEKYLSSK